MLAALNEINMLLMSNTKLIEAIPFSLSARDSWSCANSSFGSNLPAYSTDKICFSLEAVFNYLQTSRIVTFGLITTVLILINSNQPVGVYYRICNRTKQARNSVGPKQGLPLSCCFYPIAITPRKQLWMLSFRQIRLNKKRFSMVFVCIPIPRSSKFVGIIIESRLLVCFSMFSL